MSGDALLYFSNNHACYMKATIGLGLKFENGTLSFDEKYIKIEDDRPEEKRDHPLLHLKVEEAKAKALEEIQAKEDKEFMAVCDEAAKQKPPFKMPFKASHGNEELSKPSSGDIFLGGK